MGKKKKLKFNWGALSIFILMLCYSQYLQGQVEALRSLANQQANDLTSITISREQYKTELENIHRFILVVPPNLVDIKD